MKIESKIGKSTSSDQVIYTFVGNFHNFKDLLPADKVSGWESSEDKCSFQVDPLGRTGLMIVEKNPYSLVKMSSDPEFSKYQFTIWIQLKKVATIPSTSAPASLRASTAFSELPPVLIKSSTTSTFCPGERRPSIRF